MRWWMGWLLLGGVGCTTASNPSLPSNDDAFGGVKCSAVRPQTEPDLMGWDSGARSKLNDLRNQGVVAVRYSVVGCNVELEVLDSCIGKGRSYTFTTYAANESKVMHDAQELFAALPVGAARLGGKLKGGHVLRTDYMLVGSYRLPADLAAFPDSDLSGDCARATHVVRAVHVGGFSLAAGASREMDGGASLFGIGAGVQSTSSVERLSNEGVAEACVESQRSGQASATCSVPLRIALMPIGGRSTTTPSASSNEKPSTPPSTEKIAEKKPEKKNVDPPKDPPVAPAAPTGECTGVTPRSAGKFESKARANDDRAMGESYLSLDYTTALRSLEATIHQCGTSDCSSALLAKLYLHKGVVSAAMGDDNGALAAFRLARKQCTNVTLEKDYSSAKTNALWERSASPLSTAAQGERRAALAH